MLGKVMPLFCAAAGIYFAAMGGFKYHVWMNGPYGGFLPLVIGTFVAVLSIAVFLQERKPVVEGQAKKETEKFDFSALIPPAIVLAAILLSYIIGMLPAVALMVFSWLAFIEKVKPLKALFTSAILLLFVWLIFSMWLRVPFPTGIFEY